MRPLILVTFSLLFFCFFFFNKFKFTCCDTLTNGLKKLALDTWLHVVERAMIVPKRGVALGAETYMYLDLYTLVPIWNLNLLTLTIMLLRIKYWLLRM